MFNFPKTKLFLSTKEEYKNTTFQKNNWAFVHIGEELFNQTKSSIDKSNFKSEKVIIIENHLYLNWLDLSAEEYFNLIELELVLNFIESEQEKRKNILVHCDYAQSRSPSILMTYVYKRIKSNISFYTAIEEFSKIYPNFFYPSGITKFLKTNWNIIK